VATTEPLTGITVQDQSDPAQGGLQIGALAKAVAPLTIPRYANASARDSASSSFTTAGGVLAEGQYCDLASDNRLYRYDAGAWKWAPWAQGQLCRAEFTDTVNSATNFMTPLAAAATGLPAFNVSTPTVPAGRNLKVSFSGQIMADAAGTSYGFVLAFAGFQRRGVVHIPIASTTAAPVAQQFHIAFMFTTPNATTPATGGITAGGRFAGSGNCYLVCPSNGLDNPMQFLVEDMGAA
jgi:hypothetical protein